MSKCGKTEARQTKRLSGKNIFSFFRLIVIQKGDVSDKLNIMVQPHGDVVDDGHQNPAEAQAVHCPFHHFLRNLRHSAKTDEEAEPDEGSVAKSQDCDHKTYMAAILNQQDDAAWNDWAKDATENDRSCSCEN